MLFCYLSALISLIDRTRHEVWSIHSFSCVYYQSLAIWWYMLELNTSLNYGFDIVYFFFPLVVAEMYILLYRGDSIAERSESIKQDVDLRIYPEKELFV